MTAMNQAQNETKQVQDSEKLVPETRPDRSDEQIRWEIKQSVKRHSKLLHRLAKL
jgi:hypothetical protein